MKAQRLFQVLGLLDEDLIDEAWTYVPEKKASLLRRSPWLQGAAVAACCVVMCTFGFFYLVTGGFRGMGSTAPETAARRITAFDKGETVLLCVCPIVVQGDVEGGVLLTGRPQDAAPDTETARAVNIAAAFLAKWMEE